MCKLIKEAAGLPKPGAPAGLSAGSAAAPGAAAAAGTWAAAGTAGAASAGAAPGSQAAAGGADGGEVAVTAVGPAPTESIVVDAEIVGVERDAATGEVLRLLAFQV